MSLFIQNNLLLSGEEIILQRGQLHFIIFKLPVILTIAAFWFASQALLVPNLILAGMGLLTTIAWISALIRLFSTEFIVTNQRIFYRTGLLSVTTTEIALRQIEQVRTEQNIAGVMLNYGSLIITGVGGTVNSIDYLANPKIFETALQSGLATKT